MKHVGLYFVFVLATFWQTIFSIGISPLLFKNINQCFKEGCELYSPIFGSAALQSGLIENLRFYNIERGIDAGHRHYINDKAPAHDPIMDIIKILFPSPAGQLTSLTDANSNFGKHCTDPKQVAFLLNFTYKIRSFLTQGNKFEPGANIISILTQTKQRQAKEQMFPNKPFKKEKIKTLKMLLYKG